MYLKGKAYQQFICGVVVNKSFSTTALLRAVDFVFVHMVTPYVINNCNMQMNLKFIKGYSISLYNEEYFM